MKQVSATALIALLLLWSLPPGIAQNAGSAREPEQSAGNLKNLIDRDVKAVGYRARSSQTAVDLKGTDLMPRADGIARATNQRGYTEIEVIVDRLEPATHFGPEYLTYVLWAITPEGRPANLGELVLRGDDAVLDDVTTQLPTFGLIVTAEPHFAVTHPSDVVVLQNVIRRDTVGNIEEIDAHVELLPRGVYRYGGLQNDLEAIEEEDDTPYYLVQARNAVRIASASGAEDAAPEVLEKAHTLLGQAENMYMNDEREKDIETVARQAAQTAEDAWAIAYRRAEQERVSEKLRAAADREAQIQAEIEASKRRAAEAEAARLEAERLQREATTEAERLRNETARLSEEARTAKELADRQAMESQKALADAEKERAELRAKLNEVLKTQDTPRGLMLDMSDVVFDTGKYALKTGAQDKLARVASVLADNPDLKIEVEGHTDSVGSEESNQVLSERRAEAVKDHLVMRGVPATSITARGFGESRPIASNDTAEGRQRNRRVEVIVSGETIGTPPVTSQLTR